MSYEIHLNIPEDSQSGHLIASLAAEQHITLGQAVEKIIDQAVQRQIRPSLAPSGPETPAELAERLRAHKKAQGSPPRVPKNADGSLALIGMMSGNEKFSRTMDAIVNGRHQR